MQAPETPTTAVPPPPAPALRGRPRPLRIAFFLAMAAWYVCARAVADSAATGLALRADLSDLQPVLRSVFLLFLVLLGLSVLRNLDRRYTPLSIVVGLPKRKTSAEEWGVGAAIGWGLAVASVLPLFLMRSLNMHLWTGPRTFVLTAISVIAIAAATLATGLALYGFGFQNLIEATGPVRATLVMMALVGAGTVFTPAPLDTPDGVRLMVALLATVLLSLCWIRTRGLWLLWGLYFAWAACTALLFGLPISNEMPYDSVIDSRTSGPLWLTGGSYGPMAAAFSIVLLLIAITVLVRVTSEYAWDYARPVLIPAGYEVEIPPPAAHTAMEQVAPPPPPPPLVQILPAPPGDSGPE